jgi:hypothetical protein
MKKIKEPKQPDFYYQFNDGLHKFPKKKARIPNKYVRIPPNEMRRESKPAEKAKKKNWQKNVHKKLEKKPIK